MADEVSNQSTSSECECRADSIILLPCAGGSNCGQITNQVAVKLDEEGMGRIYCLAGIASHIEGMIESARSAERIIALDGCQMACAKKAIEHAGLTVTDWVCVTEEGISKNHQFKLSPEEIGQIAQRTKELLARPAVKNEITRGKR